ncbi:MAG: TIGR03668 family PPOX class F420-dependent oxidoreductase [Actinobacteria bacterium]|nr:TIGR03668 family PPOX class F420-dependent oxidoreductase [Actinomycetota bacterium]
MSELPAEAREILDYERRGILATIDEHGRPHAVPVCYVVSGDEILTPIDAKPKSGRTLGRRRNLERDPKATFLVDRWDEDWSKLGWVMARGTARLEPAGRADEALAARYPQYRDVLVGSEVISIQPNDIVWWLWR